jgi:transposase-like protein
MKMKTRKRYTDEFKAQAVALAKLGKPVSEVAKDLEIPADLVYRWKKEDAQSAQGGSGGQRAVGEMAGADELRTLGGPRAPRQVVHLKRENDILKKAAIILGTAPQ